MRIYRHPKSKVWFAQYRNRRFSLRTKDEKAARLKLAAIQRREADPTYREADPAATLKRELGAFIERQKERGRSPGTIAMYELHARALTSSLGAETPIALIDAAAIERFVSEATRAGDSKSYRWKQICTLRGTLKRSRKLGLYPYALDQVMPDDLQPDYTPLTRHLLLPEVAALLAELPPKRRAVVAFVVATGADVASIWRATPADFSATTIRVRGSKTASRARVVPVLAVFRELAAEAAAGAPYEPWASMRRDLMRATTRAGVGPLAKDADPADERPARHVTARDLRRSTGRILRAAGVHPSLIGPVLGHAPGSAVTAQTYAQIEPAELGAQIDSVTAKDRQPDRQRAPATGKKTVRAPARPAKKTGKRRAA